MTDHFAGTFTIAAAAAIVVSIAVPGIALADDPAAAPTIAPCDWVTAEEASQILEKPVTAATRTGDEETVLSCRYETPEDGFGAGVGSTLFLPSRFGRNKTTQFADMSAEPTATPITGLGVQAVCNVEPKTTPPSTTVLVLLDGGRAYQATATYVYCDTVERFARTAIDRISS